jgi:hypothetical protein
MHKRQLYINLFAPEDPNFFDPRLGANNRPDDAERLRRWIKGLATTLRVEVAVFRCEPGVQGSFDVILEGSERDLRVFALELGEPEDSLRWRW